MDKKKKNTILTVICMILIIVLIFYARKIIILKNITQKMDEYTNSNNYYIWNSYYNGLSVVITEIWTKDNELLLKLNSDEMTYAIKNDKLYEYSNNEWKDVSETADEKNMINSNWGAVNNLKEEFNSFTSIFKYKITSNIINGKNCYRIKKYALDGDVIYIEKDTGLLIRYETIMGEHNDNNEIQSTIRDYKYEFNNVNENFIDF